MKELGVEEMVKIIYHITLKISASWHPAASVNLLQRRRQWGSLMFLPISLSFLLIFPTILPPTYHYSMSYQDIGCFQTLATISRKANKIVHQLTLLQNKVCFGYMPKSSRAGSWGRLIPIFLRNHHNDSIITVKVYTPTSNSWVFPWLYILFSMTCH